MSLLDGMKDALENPLATAMEAEDIADEEEFYAAIEESLGIDDLDDGMNEGLHGVSGVPGSTIDAEDDELMAGLISDEEAESMLEDPELGEDDDDINFGNEFEFGEDADTGEDDEDEPTLEQLCEELEGTLGF